MTPLAHIDDLEFISPDSDVEGMGAGAGMRVCATVTTTRQSGARMFRDEAALCVDLCGDICRYRDDDGEVVLDFAHRRRLVIQRQRGTYSVDSLYPTVAFRVAERTNRERIVAAMETTIETDDSESTYPLLPALFAHQLSLATDGDDDVQRVRVGDDVRWQCGQHLLLSHSLRVRRIAPDKAREFVRFARYHLRGHPLILAHLQALAGLPVRMTWVQHGADELQTQELTVTRVEPSPVDGYRLEGLERVPTDSDFWSQHLHDTLNAGELDQRRVEQDILRALDAARADGRYDEAVLLCLEYAMQNGPLPPGIDSLAPFMGDPGAQAIMACVAGQRQVRNEADAHTLIGSIRALRGHFVAKRHVLMMLEAHLYAAIEAYDQAERLYREIVSCNRYLAAVYKDLGDLFAGRFDMDRAWRCWQLARHLAPQHQRLDGVNRRESKLRAAHPEYF